MRKGNVELIAKGFERVLAACDVRARFDADPVSVVHRYTERGDQEIAAVVAASIAFGNAKTIKAKAIDALDRLGPHPSRAADDARFVQKRLRGWRHRVFQDRDLAKLIVGARLVQKEWGTLGARFEDDWDKTSDIVKALSRFTGAIRTAGGLKPDGNRRGPQHLLPDLEGKSACKRMMLLLRWMVRPADGVDLGLWNVPASALLVPVDTHILKIGRNLRMTNEETASMKAAREITAVLASIDPKDPVRFDFPLCHVVGMQQRCPSKRDVRCDGCAVRAVCKHWDT